MAKTVLIFTLLLLAVLAVSAEETTTVAADATTTPAAANATADAADATADNGTPKDKSDR
ncbi:unnamed protein product [Plutella xylostella]|uniref:(diamondback moth) hypothetical protein n=1 Tax=Plutella xylostella TaxID=51655 RepID=A0A8S4F5Y3_PLUXY|nr:unnamed protein product [Plutella xylostella]